MSIEWDRRSFLATLLGAVPAMSLAARAVHAADLNSQGNRRISAGGRIDGLPPRVIGLRTDGGNFRFDPVGLVIEAGATVVWLNMGDFHSTTAFHPDNAALVGGNLPLRIPEGAQSWHSGMLGLTSGTDFSHTFTVEGVYDYLCQPHYMFGMVGRIVVGRPHDGPGTAPMDGLPDPVVNTMPALETVIGAAARSNEWASRFNGVLYLIAEGREAGEAAAGLQKAIAADKVLKSQSDRAGVTQALEFATDEFVKAVRSGVDYERLVTLSDVAKTQLAGGVG
ncbi:MAG: hypothetical protein BMS9Abin29_1206 [Gemmatimonadota bacterium]|nr:MAG: hypothetical protein BMS9Abin29_1206 [Gemmatimonadota bacterium]